MCKILAITMILPALLAAAQIERGGKIVGGTQAQRNGYPYQVAIVRSRGVMHCGGSVLNANYVLTAAHCEMVDVTVYKVIAGAHSYKSYKETGQERAIDKFTPHPNWNGNAGNGFDIATIKVKVPFNLNQYVVAITLNRNLAYPTGPATATGWGLTKGGDFGSIPEFLQVVTVSMIPYKECSQAWGGLPKNVTCAGSPNKDTCQGDSGGPLVQGRNGVWVQIGVTSFGEQCASATYPGVYTEVSKYIKWLNV